MILSNLSNFTVVEPFLKNLEAASKLGHKALKESDAFVSALHFPVNRNELITYIQLTRRSIVDVYRRVEPCSQLLIRYLHDANSEIAEFEQRTHPNYPENFLKKFKEVERGIRSLLTEKLNSCQMLESTCTFPVPKGSGLNAELQVPVQPSIQEPQGTCSLPDPKGSGINVELQVPLQQLTRTPDSSSSQLKFQNSIHESEKSNLSQENMDVSLDSSIDEIFSFHTPKIIMEGSGNRSRKSKALTSSAQKAALELEIKECIEKSGVHAITREILANRISNGETLLIIARGYTENVLGKHPEEIKQMLIEVEKLKKVNKIEELIQKLEEISENLKIRLGELDAAQALNDPEFARLLGDSTTESNTKIYHNQLDRKFFMGHITNMKPLYENDTTSSKNRKKKDNQFTPYPNAIPRSDYSSSESEIDLDQTPRITRHSHDTRASKRNEIGKFPDYSNIKPMEISARFPNRLNYDITPLHSTPHRAFSSPSFEIPRANDSGGSSRPNTQEQNARIKQLEEELHTLTELLRTQGRIETERILRETNSNTHPNAYMPKIEIPPFSGKMEDFPRFWEAFTSIIDSQHWPDVAKFSYLLTKLDGKAATLVRMIPLTAAGYPIAKEKLKQSYMNPQIQEATLESKFDFIQKAKPDAESIIQTLCEVETIIEMRKAYETQLDHTALIRRVGSFFPVEINTKALEHLDGRKDVGLFLAHIRKQAEMKRLAEITISERINIIRDKDLCYSCLSTSHTSRRCKEPPCRVCNKPHHSSICRSYSNNDNQERKQTRRNHDDKRGRSPYRKEYRNREFKNNNSHQSRSRSRGSFQNKNYARSKSPYTDRSQSRESYRSNNSRYNNRDRSDSRPRKNRKDQTPYRKKNQNYNSRSSSRDVKRTLKINGNRNQTNLMIFEAHIETYEGEEIVYGILDTGADCSFVTERLANKVESNDKFSKRISIATLGNKEEPFETTTINDFKLYNNNDECVQIAITTFPEIIDNITPVHLSKHDIKFINNYKLQLPAFLQKSQISIDILIGLDNFNVIYENGSNSFKLPSGLMISSTFFGNIIYGSTVNPNNSMIANVNTIKIKALMTSVEEFDLEEESHINIEKMWDLESIKIFDNISKSEEEQKVLQNFMQTVTREDDGIHVGLPWKEDNQNISSNFHVSLARLRQLSNQMRLKTPDLWPQYNDLFEEQLKSGIIEEVPNWKEKPGHDSPVYYMPHRAVIKQSSKTTKVRIVMDASSKVKSGLSLNDAVHQGPCILPNIAGMILRSRCGKHLITADIEKAFHQIHLNKIDRDATRFLVPIDIHAPVSEDNIKALRHTRPAFGINASPFLLAGGIYYGLDLIKNENSAEIIAEIKNNLYVDNVVLPFDDLYDGIDIYEKSKKLFRQLNMNLREYSCSLKTTRAKIQPNDKSLDKNVKLLGIDWNITYDVFTMNMTLGSLNEILTKRKILQAAHSTYDPLGFLAPLFIKPRHFIQKLWAHDYHWDSPLSTEHAEEWIEIYKNIHGYSTEINRSIGFKSQLSFDQEKQALNIFVDASKIAFAAVAYITYEHEIKERYRTEFLMAKHRLAPRNKSSSKLKDVLSIPRLELTSMVLGMKLAKFILEQTKFRIKRINILGDSTIALSWLTSDKSNGVFVDNRTREIKLHMEYIKTTYGIPTHFYHVATEHNNADLATRGLDKRNFDASRWFYGPTFLSKTINNKFDHVPHVKEVHFKQATDAVAFKIKTVYEENELLNYENKSYEKSVNIMAYVLRFIRNSRPNKRTRCLEFYDEIPQVESTIITPLERKLAEFRIIKDIQKHINRNDNKFKNLQLFQDGEGIIRLYGRLNNLPNKLEANPVLLPEYHPFTLSILKHLHITSFHFGANFIRSQFRRHFWTTRLTKQIVSCIRDCWVCKKQNNKPYKYPKMAQMPETRLQRSAPFEHIGIDLAGPFRVRDKDSTIVNRFIALFTCFTTRAIHLETLESTSALDFGLCFRKFSARRGVPKTILSDNASNFTATKATLDEIRQGNNSLLTRTTWKFITPLSPWKGGMYERMIGLVKKALKSMLKLPCPILIFDTVVTETESVINMRPLSAVIDSMHDYNPIRPVDLLSPGSCFSTSEFDPSSDLPHTLKSHQDLVNSLQEIKIRLDTLWNRWYTDYILNLREKHSLSMKQARTSKNVPNIGSIILIADEKVPRNQWKLGVVISLHPSDSPRSAKVRTVNTVHFTPKQTYKNKVLIRSINHLVPLEITVDQDFAFVPNIAESAEQILCEEATSQMDTFPLSLNNSSVVVPVISRPHGHPETADQHYYPPEVENTFTEPEAPEVIDISSDESATPLRPSNEPSLTHSSTNNDDIIYEGFRPNGGILRSHRLPRRAH